MADPKMELFQPLSSPIALCPKRAHPAYSCNPLHPTPVVALKHTLLSSLMEHTRIGKSTAVEKRGQKGTEKLYKSGQRYAKLPYMRVENLFTTQSKGREV